MSTPLKRGLDTCYTPVGVGSTGAVLSRSERAPTDGVLADAHRVIRSWSFVVFERVLYDALL